MPSSARRVRARQPSPPDLHQVARGITPFQRHEWIGQRTGWVLLGIFLIAGVLGLFGGGMLAETSVVSPAGTLNYERFVRRHSHTRWQVELKSLAEGRVDVAIDSALARHFEIVRVNPDPVSASLSGDRWVFQFDVAESGEALIVFHVEPQHIGQHAGAISVNGAAPFVVSQLTYP